MKGEFQGFLFLSGNRETGSDYSLAIFTAISGFNSGANDYQIPSSVPIMTKVCRHWGPISEQVQHRVPHGTPKSDQEVYVPSPNSVFTSGSIAIVLAGLIQGSLFW